MIRCDTQGCTNDATWVVPTEGLRFCDECKREIVAHEKELIKRGQRGNELTPFKRETR